MSPSNIWISYVWAIPTWIRVPTEIRTSVQQSKSCQFSLDVTLDSPHHFILGRFGRPIFRFVLFVGRETVDGALTY